jgi:superfamily II DNA helicase RecQ
VVTWAIGHLVSLAQPHEINPQWRQWRMDLLPILSEAKRRNIPAFRIFGDRALKDIATNCPHNDTELLAVPGIGISIVQKYGAHIYRLIAGSR